MKTIALRFGETFSPKEGTISAHQQIIDEFGYVWYGKLGSKVSDKKIAEIMKADEPKILLIQSGRTDRFWAYISEIKNTPEIDKVPEYYRKEIDRVKTWFKVLKFEKAEKDVMSKCIVVSSGAILSNASRFSMSPYFYIETEKQ